MTQRDGDRRDGPRRRPLPEAHTGPDASVVDALLAAVAGGDVRALGDLYDRTAPMVFGLLRGALGEQVRAEQATQRVYLWIWRSAPRIDRTHISAYALLLRAARRELIRGRLADGV